jgi:general secretion pathway protein G
MKPRRLSKKGFTIVELLVVIVVIAILAAITVVAYNGIQVKARDSQRKQDVKTIAKALELYYIDNGQYPTISCASNCSINGSLVTSSDVGCDG